MTGRTAQRIKIDTFFFESRVFLYIPTVTTVTGFGLCFLVAVWVRFGMHGMTG